MRDKYTNQQLYSWMAGKYRAVYFRTYQLAYMLAKRAEQRIAFELELKQDASFIDFGYWDSLKKGLMAGERLSLDLKRMEAAYFDQNQREYQITNTSRCCNSIRPRSLRCDRPGNANSPCRGDITIWTSPDTTCGGCRKNVSLTIPCVTGPYSGVPATLRADGARSVPAARVGRRGPRAI